MTGWVGTPLYQIPYQHYFFFINLIDILESLFHDDDDDDRMMFYVFLSFLQIKLYGKTLTSDTFDIHCTEQVEIYLHLNNNGKIYHSIGSASASSAGGHRFAARSLQRL